MIQLIRIAKSWIDFCTIVSPNPDRLDLTRAMRQEIFKLLFSFCFLRTHNTSKIITSTVYRDRSYRWAEIAPTPRPPKSILSTKRINMSAAYYHRGHQAPRRALSTRIRLGWNVIFESSFFDIVLTWSHPVTIGLLLCSYMGNDAHSQLPQIRMAHFENRPWIT